MQCKEDRQLPGLKPPPPAAPPAPPPSHPSSSEGADRKVVQNIIVNADWAWAIRREQAQTPRKSLVRKKMIWMQFCGFRNNVSQKGLPLQPVSRRKCEIHLLSCSSLLRKKSQDGFRDFQKTTKTPVQKLSQLVTNVVQQSGFIVLISSSDIWRSWLAKCLSCAGRYPAMPSKGKRASQHLASQKPRFILSHAFLPLQQQISSTQIVHLISISLLRLFGWAYLYLYCSYFLSPWLSITAGCTVKIIMLGLARCDHFSTHFHQYLLPLPTKHTNRSNPGKLFWI